LSDHDFIFKTMDEAIFRDTLMYNVEMKESSFAGCDFTGSKFDGVNAYAAIFDDCDFIGAKFNHSNFQRASMVACDFTNVDFGNTEFHNAVLDNSNLTGAKTRSTDFSQTRMNGCIGLTDTQDEEEFQATSMQ